jgi:hypothetical protein
MTEPKSLRTEEEAQGSKSHSATPSLKPAAVKQTETAFGQIKVVMAQQINRCAVRELLQIRTPDIRKCR